MHFRKKSEIELLEGIIASDISAYDAVYRRWFPILHSFAKGMLKDNARAEDIAQTVLMKLWAKRVELNPELSLKNFLYVAAKNEILNYLKSKSHSSMSYLGQLPECISNEAGADARASLAETRQLLERLIQELPPKRQAVLRLSRFEHLDTMEIARRLDISPRTVEKHLELALKELRPKFN